MTTEPIKPTVPTRADFTELVDKIPRQPVLDLVESWGFVMTARDAEGKPRPSHKWKDTHPISRIVITSNDVEITLESLDYRPVKTTITIPFDDIGDPE